MANYYCPDCVEKLIPDKKKLGMFSTWIICPNCGYRTRPGSIDFEEGKKKEKLSSEREENNKTGGYHEIEI